MAMDLYDAIPNNVNLREDKRLYRALERWLPNYQSWWRETGPVWSKELEVYLRTAISVESGGWANFDYVKLPDYRWGIFLADADEGRTVGFGDHADQPAWQDVPGEYRNMLRRIIVTQADTEPASVEQQRLLAATAPSLYDVRNLFQVNVEEGRHLWAMVYLLHGYFGRDGRDEAEALLERRSGDVDKPRILDAFNAPVDDWLSFFMYTYFADRDGKFQLLALSKSGFDPLSRTCKFMLTEEAHHLFVGETGIERVIRRTVEAMREEPGRDPVELGVIEISLLQRYMNYWYSVCLDLFGGEISSNAADYFAAGLKGRYDEETHDEHVALRGSVVLQVYDDDDRLVCEEVAMRNAMNELLRDGYIADCERGVARWNKVLAESGVADRLQLPSRRFNRGIGLHSGRRIDPWGNLISDQEWESGKHQWLPTEADRLYVDSLMLPVLEPGKIASWIAPPRRGIDGKSADFEYVRG